MEGILAIIVGGLIILVPLAGLTMRFALKPLIDSLIRIAEVRRSSQEVQLLESRISLLEQELNTVRDDMRRLSDEREFDRKLGRAGE